MSEIVAKSSKNIERAKNRRSDEAKAISQRYFRSDVTKCAASANQIFFRRKRRKHELKQKLSELVIHPSGSENHAAAITFGFELLRQTREIVCHARKGGAHSAMAYKSSNPLSEFVFLYDALRISKKSVLVSVKLSA